MAQPDVDLLTSKWLGYDSLNLRHTPARVEYIKSHMIQSHTPNSLTHHLSVLIRHRYCRMIACSDYMPAAGRKVYIQLESFHNWLNLVGYINYDSQPFHSKNLWCWEGISCGHWVMHPKWQTRSCIVENQIPKLEDYG